MLQRVGLILLGVFAVALLPQNQRHLSTALVNLGLPSPASKLRASTTSSGVPEALGGDIAAVRYLLDPYPVFNGIAIDAEKGIVVASDTNRKSLLLYDRASAKTKSAEATQPMRQVIGPETSIGFVAGVAVDPRSSEIYAVNNDIEDTLVVFSYADNGNAKPIRRLAVPHQAWGVAVSPSRNELAVSVQGHNGIVIYRREADSVEAPLRSIHGVRTGMADPHGLYWDGDRNEIGVANHGNFRGLARNIGAGCMTSAGPEDSRGGKLDPPSITIYPASAKEDVEPLRTIKGPRTRLDWPMGIAVDSSRGEIFVANNGDNSILVFRVSDSGDVAPARVIRGERTGIDRPMGVAVDAKSKGLWVANFGNHRAVFFPAGAEGNVEPTGIIRNAPAGTPNTGFGNPMAVAFDSKRREILVPN